jgi:5-methylcytosine-specific restriction endonuclease McrA
MQAQYIPAAEKRCARCGIIKPVDAFHPLSRMDRRPRPHCRQCHYAAKKAAGPYKRNPWENVQSNLARRGGRISIPELRKSIGEPTTCYLCGDPITWGIAALDHRVPTSRGGGHALVNLAWACRRCNQAKGTMTPDEFVALASKVASIANRQRWKHVV